VDDQVQAAIADAESRQRTRAPDVLRWIEAAFFADLFPATIELTLTLTRRRRELFQRRAYRDDPKKERTNTPNMSLRRRSMAALYHRKHN
jgi:hypothetical protein